MRVSRMIRELNDILESYGDAQVYVKDEEDDFVVVSKIDVEEASSDSADDEWEVVIS